MLGRRGRVPRARGRRATRAGCASCWTASSTTPAAGTGRSPRCSTRRSRARTGLVPPQVLPRRGVRRRAVPRELRVLVGPARPAQAQLSTTRASASTSWTSARSGCASSTSTAGVWITRSRSSRVLETVPRPVPRGKGSVRHRRRAVRRQAGRRRRGRALRLAHELRVRDVRGGVRGRRRGAQAGRRHRRGLPDHARGRGRVSERSYGEVCRAYQSAHVPGVGRDARGGRETRWAQGSAHPAMLMNLFDLARHRARAVDAPRGRGGAQAAASDAGVRARPAHDLPGHGGWPDRRARSGRQRPRPAQPPGVSVARERRVGRGTSVAFATEGAVAERLYALRRGGLRWCATRAGGVEGTETPELIAWERAFAIATTATRRGVRVPRRQRSAHERDAVDTGFGANVPVKAAFATRSACFWGKRHGRGGTRLGDVSPRSQGWWSSPREREDYDESRAKSASPSIDDKKKCIRRRYGLFRYNRSRPRRRNKYQLPSFVVRFRRSTTHFPPRASGAGSAFFPRPPLRTDPSTSPTTPLTPAPTGVLHLLFVPAAAAARRRRRLSRSWTAAPPPSSVSGAPSRRSRTTSASRPSPRCLYRTSHGSPRKSRSIALRPAEQLVRGVDLVLKD